MRLLRSLANSFFALAVLTLPATAGEWVYAEHVDEMRSETTQIASLESTNILVFPFPYDAANNHASLWLWKLGETGQQMGVSVASGQFTCSESSGDRIAVKIDDDPIEYVPCSGGARGQYNLIYFQINVWPLIDRIRSSSRLIIEADFYGSGRHQMNFDTSDLVW